VKHKLVVEGGDSGDMSVGIGSMRFKMTIESDVDMKQVYDDIHYEDNEKVFIKDVKDFVGGWLTDFKVYVESIKVG